MRRTQNFMPTSIMRGASLIEMLVSIFVFVLVVIGSSAILIGSFNNQKTVRKLQKDYDKSSVAVNEIAKVITTGTLPSGTVEDDNSSSVVFYSASQNACIRYTFIGQRIRRTALLMGTDSPNMCDKDGNYLSSTPSQILVDVEVQGHFYVRPEVPGSRAASVTIFMEVVPDVADAGQNMFLQTTAALRKSITDF